MANHNDQSPKPHRVVPPPFMGPPRLGALSPTTRTDRAAAPPFAPPFAKRPSPAVSPQPAELKSPKTEPAPAPAAEPAWREAVPNEMASEGGRAPAEHVGTEWVNPDVPAATAPAQAPTGIAWLDSPEPEAAKPPAQLPASDVDDVFGWDPAEERPGALDTAPVAATLEALKELEPWALPGGEVGASASEELAVALERVAARIRSGDLVVPGATTVTDEAALACVLAALLQRAHG